MKKILLLSLLLVLAVFTPILANAQYYTGLCLPNSYQACSGNYLYWYDSCGNQQGISQYCQNGCYNNSCQNSNNYNNYGNCTYHAYKLCVGNNVYWFDSCNTQQDLVTSCISGLTCQYGQCTNVYVNPVPEPIHKTYYRVACSAGNLHWFDTLGTSTGIYKYCQNGCQGGKCIQQQSSSSASSVSSSSSSSSQNNSSGLSVSFFAKPDANSTQWQKASQINSNGQIYFLISVSNNSANQISNITVSTNIPAEISSLGNVQADKVAVSGDIVTGINIGSLAPNTTKLVTFEGRAGTISQNSTKQAIATTSVDGKTQTDSVSLTISTSQSQASVSGNTSSGFLAFLKRWYLWILAGVVLIILFIIIFRRLSTNV